MQSVRQYKHRYLLWFVILLLITRSVWAQTIYSGAAVDYINVYQKHLSALKNTKCSMYPSCSQYAKMVFSDNSFPVAMVKTADRLLRCGHDLNVYQKSLHFESPVYVDYPSEKEIPAWIKSEDPINISAGSQPIEDSLDYAISFINSLINEKNYECALLEIEKIMFINDPDSLLLAKPILFVDKLKCYEGLNRCNDAVLIYEQFPPSVKIQYPVLFYGGYLYGKIGDYRKASELIDLAAHKWNSTYANPYGELSLAYFNIDDFERTKESLISKLQIDRNQTDYKRSIKVIDEYLLEKKKKSALAGSLSVIPGLGYLYTNQPQNAITAFVIVGTLSYATFTSFKAKNYGVGAIVGILSLSFYMGNIHGSAKSADRYNSLLKKQAYNQLRTINPFIN